MPGGVRELTLRLVAETDKMSAGIQSVDNKLGGFKKGLAAVGGVMAGAFAVDQVMAFGKAALDEASNIAESTSKIKTVFGDASGAVIKFGKDANKSMGLADEEALSYLGTLGSMWTGLGKTQDESAALSEGTMKLAADLGSFNNVSTPETLDMMSAAFRGEYDSIQRMLPGLNAAAVEQEALAQTHKTSAKELTQTEKAMATLSLMYKQAGPAIGDFERTSEGAANQQKIMQANMEDMKATIGNVLLPAFNAILSFINTVLFPGISAFVKWITGSMVPGIVGAWEDVYKYIGPPIQQIVKYVTGLWEVFWNIVMLIKNVFTGNWSEAWDNIVGIFKGVVKAISGYMNLVWIYIQTIWNAILAFLKWVGSWILDALTYPFRLAWSFISFTIGAIVGGIKDAWSGVWSWLVSVGRSIKNAITWPFESAWDFIKSMWNNTLGKISFTVPKWIPGIGGNKFEMPKLAAGGIVSRPMLALVGEAGPEAVIPLRKLGQMGGGAVYHINVTAGVGDPYVIGQQVVAALQAYERIAGPRPSGTRGSGRAA